MSFLDHFSEAAADYAAIRPGYPDALFAFVASAAPARQRVWDCATGNGQAALGLAAHFAAVEATDASREQIAHAIAAPRVNYSVQPAERSGFPPHSFDAVCVAQALHWFEQAVFFGEVRRVLRPGGLLATWGYNWFSVDPAFDQAVRECLLDPMRDSWPPQNRLLWDGYRDVHYPFPRIPTPAFALQPEWSFEELLGFVHSWSGTRRHIAAAGRAFFDRAEAHLRPLWGTVARRRVVMPITFVACRATQEESG